MILMHFFLIEFYGYVATIGRSYAWSRKENNKNNMKNNGSVTKEKAKKLLIEPPKSANTNFLSLIQVMKSYGVSKSFLYQCKSTGRLKFYYVLRKRKPFINIAEFEGLMKPE